MTVSVDGGADTGLLPVPARIILLGFGGLCLMAASSVGAAAVLVPDPVLNGSSFSWLGYGHGKMLATALYYVGVAMFVLAWVRLGREVRAGTVDVRGMLIAIGAWVVPLLVAPPLSSRDMFSYLAQGDLALHGYNPYEYGVSMLNDHLSANVDPIWQNTPAPYGPLFILLAKCVVVVTGQSTVVGVLAMRATMCIGLLLLCWALPRLADHLGGRPTVALWLGVANPFVLIYLVGGGHNDLLMMGLLTAGATLVLRRRHAGGMSLVACAFAVKATAGVALPFLMWIWAARLPGSARARFVRASLGTLAVVVPVFALCTLAAGVNLGWLPALSSSSVVTLWLSLPTMAGQIAHFFANLVTPVDTQMFMSAARLAGMLIMLTIVGRQWWRSRAGDPHDTVRYLAVAMCWVALLSPATLPWYFSWALILAATLARSLPAMVVGTVGSLWITLITFPTGTSGLAPVPGLLALLAAGLAAWSLVRPDPLGLSGRLRVAHTPRVAPLDPGSDVLPALSTASAVETR